MAVPNLSRAVRGWTKRKTVKIITKATVNHKVTESTSNTTLNINVQPMPARQVDRKPEGERSWSWWSIIIRDPNVLLKTDDIVEVDGAGYRITKGNDWRRSGFTKYEAIQDYTEST